jgi:hypothetical protein
MHLAYVKTKSNDKLPGMVGDQSENYEIRNLCPETGVDRPLKSKHMAWNAMKIPIYLISAYHLLMYLHGITATTLNRRRAVSQSNCSNNDGQFRCTRCRVLKLTGESTRTPWLVADTVKRSDYSLLFPRAFPTQSFSDGPTETNLGALSPEIKPARQLGGHGQSNCWEIFCSGILGHLYRNEQEAFRANTTFPCALTMEYFQATPANYALKTGGK